MDPAVALVQAYLYANQYFTVTEYPVVASVGPGQYRTVTDVDVIAVRFPGAGRLVPGSGAHGQEESIDGADPALEAPDDRIHVLLGEVKEGKAELNRGTRDAGVLRAALRRIGVYGRTDHDTVVADLIRTGRHDSDRARVQLVAFGSYPGDRGPFSVITHRTMIRSMRALAREHWGMLQNAQFKDPALAFLVLLEKSRFDQPDRARPSRRRRRRGRHDG